MIYFPSCLICYLFFNWFIRAEMSLTTYTYTQTHFLLVEIFHVLLLNSFWFWVILRKYWLLKDIERCIFFRFNYNFYSYCYWGADWLHITTEILLFFFFLLLCAISKSRATEKCFLGRAHDDFLKSPPVQYFCIVINVLSLENRQGGQVISFTLPC